MNHALALKETMVADSFRNRVVMYMLEHLSDYEALGQDGPSIDLPIGMRYNSFSDRISEMSKHSTQAGHFELVALSKILDRQLVIKTDSGRRVIGEQSSKLFLNFTSLGNDSGHYCPIIEE